MDILEYLADVKTRATPETGLNGMRRRAHVMNEDLPILLNLASKATEALIELSKSDSARARYLSEKALKTLQWYLESSK